MPVHNQRFKQYTTINLIILSLALSGGITLASLEEVRHDILIIIVAGLFILFATALAIPLATPVEPIIIP